MTTKEIAFYYKNLPNGEKGRFTAHISLELGGSPHSWQQHFLRWGPAVLRVVSGCKSTANWHISTRDFTKSMYLSLIIIDSFGC